MSQRHRPPGFSREHEEDFILSGALEVTRIAHAASVGSGICYGEPSEPELRRGIVDDELPARQADTANGKLGLNFAPITWLPSNSPQTHLAQPSDCLPSLATRGQRRHLDGTNDPGTSRAIAPVARRRIPRPVEPRSECVSGAGPGYLLSAIRINGANMGKRGISAPLAPFSRRAATLVFQRAYS